MSLTQYNRDQIPALLASRTIDASKGVLFGSGANMEPNKANRTILIGLGGTGVKTIDYVKGAIDAKLKSTWKRYVAFLGIDSDWNEFNRAKFLDKAEQEMITVSNVGQHGVRPASRTIAQRRVIPDEKTLPGLDGPGAGQKRLIGTFKIHDQDPGGIGVDERIVDHIRNAAQSLDAFASGDPGSFEVYVIGSVCGGTCSGIFLEMPALIQTALKGKRVHPRAILYLPDTLVALDPTSANQIYANGYAALKELDYYMGESMRTGYCDTWGYNNNSSSEISLPDPKDPNPTFFGLPYLVGSQNPGSLEASEKARETIAEHLVSLLSEMRTSGQNANAPGGGNAQTDFSIESHFDNAKRRMDRNFLNPVSKKDEADGENHDRPKHYAAIGFAEASAPQKTVRAYSVGKICNAAGLKPLPKNDRASLISHGEVHLLPFRAEDDLLTAIEGTNAAEEIMKPVATILGTIHSGTFNFVADLDLNEQEITWRRIRDHEFDAADIVNNSNHVLTMRTNTTAMNMLREKIRAAFNEYTQNVIRYIKDEGPLAFSNLYFGRFIPNGEDFGTGIQTMIKNLSIGKTTRGLNYAGWVTPNDAQKKLQDVRNEINETRATIFNINLRNQQQAVWVQAYEEWMRSRINEKLRTFAIGSNGAFVENFMNPAELMTDEIRTFGYILEGITDIYDGFGSKMDSFDAFRQARDNKTEVNLAAVNDSAYRWIKTQADNDLANVNAKQFRDNLVDDFFANRSDWMYVPDNCVESNLNAQTVKLIHEDNPVPARTKFDEFAANNMPPVMNVSIQALFDQLNGSGVSYQTTATDIVNSLASQSSLQFNGNVTASFVIAVYPDSLIRNGGANGSAIASAIQQAFQLKFQGKSLQVVSSADTDSIRCYQLAAPFEMYHLHELASWEREYESRLREAMPQSSTVSRGVEALLHGMSPAAEGRMGQTYQDVMPWEDYPSVVLYNKDPRIPDPKTGLISREGELRIKLDGVIAEAKKLGALYCEEVAGGFLVYRVHCDQTIQWDRFDLTACYCDPNTGLIPIGKALAESIATQHGKTLGAVSKAVVLNEGGIFSGAAPTEDLAWRNAARVLRAHVPMYRELVYTLKLFRKWGEDVISYNDLILQRLRPAKMVWMMRALKIYKRDDNAWAIVLPDGNEKVLANLSKTMMNFIPPKDKKFIDNGLLSYLLFNKLEAALKPLSGITLDDAYRQARKTYEEYVNDMAQEELQKGRLCAEMVDTERAALLEKGMLNDDSEPVKERFRKEMKALGIALTDSELLSIQQFYYRASLADSLD